MIKVYDNAHFNYGTFETIEQAYGEMLKQIQQRQFKSYYWRYNVIDRQTVSIDYGSHTHFFYLHDDTTKDLMYDIMSLDNDEPHTMEEIT